MSPFICTKTFARQRGAILKTLFVAVIAFALLTMLWVIVLETTIQPEALAMNATPIKTRLLHWLLPPLALILVITAGGSVYAQAKESNARLVQQQQQAADEQRQKLLAQESERAQQQREFSLEVRGLGIAVDRLRQSHLWTALDKAASPYQSIMSNDASAYPGSESSRSNNFDKRRSDVWEYALRASAVERWPLPVILIAPPRAVIPVVDSDILRLSSVSMGSGLGGLMYARLEARYTDRPDQMIASLFKWFDEHPDMPAAVIVSIDGLPERDSLRQEGTEPQLKRMGNGPPALFDAMTALLVTRTDRVDAQIRAHVTDTPYDMVRNARYDTRYATARLWNFYWDHKDGGGKNQSIEKWHERVSRFLANEKPDADDSGSMTPFWDKGKDKGFKPNPWVPVRWTRWQLKQYDQAPMLGYLHRPVFIPFQDEQGKPLKESGKVRAMSAGWQQAMATLPGAGKGAAQPERVFFDTGKDTRRIIPLASALADDMPDLNPTDPQTGFNLSQRIGDTGISSPLVQIGLALMRSYAKGGVSATVNLRHDDGASIVMVRPPTEAQKSANRKQPDPFMVELLPD
jgi:hypothetical protein